MEEFDRSKSLIKQALLNKFPKWWTKINADEYYLVLTDDCDSLFSCMRLHTLFNLEVGGFYDFNSGLWLNLERTDYGWKTPIFVDLSVGRDQLCFDNHRSFLNNPNRVNPNIIPTKYNEKYNLGTIALICALYGGVEKMNEKLRTMLLAVDGGFIGYYNKGGRYSYVNTYWIEKLGLTEYLLPILEKHDMEYFQKFSVENGLYDKITINADGYLETPMYSVPDCKFELVQPIKKVYSKKYELGKYDKDKIVVAAETFKEDYVLNIAV